MLETNRLEAFANYKVKPVRRTRSVTTAEGDLVISCWYAGFQKAEAEILKYEEDLSGETNEIAKVLRTHLAEALSNASEVRAVVAVTAQVAVDPKADPATVAPARTTYYARKDLVGRICSFDGERFTVEFAARRSQRGARRPKALVSAESGASRGRGFASLLASLFKRNDLSANDRGTRYGYGFLARTITSPPLRSMVRPGSFASRPTKY